MSNEFYEFYLNMKKLLQNYPYSDLDPYQPYMDRIFKKLKYIFNNRNYHKLNNKEVITLI